MRFLRNIRVTSTQGVADRVLLGLLPSSERAYGAAVCALKPETGGCVPQHLNYHNSVTTI